MLEAGPFTALPRAVTVAVGEAVAVTVWLNRVSGVTNGVTNNTFEEVKRV